METDQLRQRWAKLPIEIITTLWPLGSVWPDKNCQMSIKSCPKMISIEKLMILTPLQKLLYNVANLDKIFVATDFEWLPKVQKSPNLVTLIGIPTLQCLKYCILLYYTCVLCDKWFTCKMSDDQAKIFQNFFCLNVFKWILKEAFMHDVDGWKCYWMEEKISMPMAHFPWFEDW